MTYPGERNPAYKHGHACRSGHSSTYRSWSTMISRCLNPHVTSFENYGGRGIGVCGRWLTYELFLQDMGERPNGTSLERVDNDGHYEPSNCRWATRTEQNNNKRNNRLITFNGRSLTIPEWARRTGIRASTIFQRPFRSGWDIEKTLTTPTIAYRTRCQETGRFQ